MEQKTERLTPDNFKIIRGFFKSLPVLEDCPPRYKDSILSKFIVEMIIQEEGYLQFEQLLSLDEKFDIEWFNACRSAMNWIMDNIDIWEYEKVIYEDRPDLEGYIQSIGFKLKKDISK
jgi:hypothetical protein